MNIGGRNHDLDLTDTRPGGGIDHGTDPVQPDVDVAPAGDPGGTVYEGALIECGRRPDHAAPRHPCGPVARFGCAGDRTSSTAQTACPSATEAPTLYPGDTWEYQDESGRALVRRYEYVNKEGLLKDRGTKRTVD